MLTFATKSLLILTFSVIAVFFDYKGGDPRLLDDITLARGFEDKAVAFLTREVPAWSKNNGCFSCHNNGDGARALYAATRKGYRLESAALDETTVWISKPARWEDNKGDPGFADKRLADIQFAATLAAAYDAGHIRGKQALEEAARRLISIQSSDGAWYIEPRAAPSSPATYGSALATFMALNTLRNVPLRETIRAIRMAEDWLSHLRPRGTIEAATVLLSSAGKPDASGRRKQSLEMLRIGQNGDGGWGPYANSGSETFDTAVALLSLAPLRDLPGLEARIRRGRNFLLTEQEDDGGWPATTRPSGGDNAQRLSTSAWATLALLETREEKLQNKRRLASTTRSSGWLEIRHFDWLSRNPPNGSWGIVRAQPSPVKEGSHRAL